MLNDSLADVTNIETECNFPHKSSNSQVNLDNSQTHEASMRTTSVRGQKHKASMIESIDERCEKMFVGIKELVDVMWDGNVVAGRHAQAIEKHAQIVDKGVSILEKHVEIAEKGVSILEKNRPHHYSEGEVWDAIEEIEIPEEHKLKSYLFLCNDQRQKLNFFGVPSRMRLQTLFKLMTDAGVQ